MTHDPFRNEESQRPARQRVRFPAPRKEPLTDATHVRIALSRFCQAEGASDAERDRVFANIKAAADYYGVTIRENDWRELELSGRRARR